MHAGFAELGNGVREARDPAAGIGGGVYLDVAAVRLEKHEVVARIERQAAEERRALRDGLVSIAGCGRLVDPGLGAGSLTGQEIPVSRTFLIAVRAAVARS